ncbi:MAG: FecR domain-containing protein [Pelomonas sp.]|nr:FecR domain-containing protein [Roseateles sp.]
MPKPAPLLTTLPLLLAATAAFAAPVCEVAALRGRAELVGGGALKLGQGLEVGAQLRTGAASRAKLRCVDGSVLVLADSSQLQIELFEPGPARRASFMLSVGLLGQKVQPAAQPEDSRWQVRTPTAVTAVRGTEFLVEVARDQSTQVHVLSGKVAVEAQSKSAMNLRGFAAKSVDAQNFHPPEAVLLDASGASTRCGGKDGCEAVHSESAAQLKRLQSRIGDF